jgi:predicted ATP-dependent protease
MQSMGLLHTVTLEPEPVPLDCKVVLVGEPIVYYLLCQLDPDFGELFKVAADFADEMQRDEEGERLYARILSGFIRDDSLRPFAAAAIARVIEYGSRLAGDAQKLSLHLREMRDLLREGHYWAGERARDLVTAADVEEALAQRIFRSDRLRERSQELILREIVHIDTAGERVGQVNGLSVLQLGDFAFGRPTRISARVRMGKGEVIDIEREVELSGPLHSKGVLILSGFLGARFAEEQPLSMAASLVFEQSYGGIDGDSASSAELYVLLSALAQVPIKQSFAVTGSVNQHGGVQAIGGVNEKIEGFFDICRARGLTGEQGVLIPRSNVDNLMLRADVVAAIDAGRFHVYPIAGIDEGIELLTGVPAGERGVDGVYPSGTINRRVQDRLRGFALKAREFAGQGAVKGDTESG